MELSKIKGVGTKTESLFNKLGIYNSDDLVRYYPYRYNVLKSNNLDENSIENQIIIGCIVTEPKLSYIRRNFNILKFSIVHNNKVINIHIYNRHFLKPHLSVNKEITLIGKYNKVKNSFEASDILLYKLKSTEVIPMYHTISGLKVKTIRSAIEDAINKNRIEEIVPDYINQEYDFIEAKDAIREIHNPTSFELLKRAKLKLKYEELFEFMFKVNLLKYKNQIYSDFLIKEVNEEKLRDIYDKLPFQLTTDQKSAISDIVNDFNDCKRMNRLILGDVGSGKTMVAFVALFLNYFAGYQGALLSPTEVLTEQHYRNLKPLADMFSIKIEMLVGSLKKKEREDILKRLESNDIDIIIGTHSLLSDEVIFNNIGLVVTDEQHRFGVNQRKSLQNKGNCVDVLYMSATPIPRTYALTIYGDMDISIIKEKPNGRKDINTSIFKFKDMNKVYEKIQEEIDKGYQVYVVCALIEEDDETDLVDLKKIEDMLKSNLNSNAKIGSMHGKMKPQEKDNVMKDFVQRKNNILISTTVIEVGVDVKNATLMVVLNAERFGLATLHQLRGRVGRNDIESSCILVSDLDSLRLKVLKESNDGFYISEKDFEMRGSGDLFGVRQSGDMAFKIASLATDYKIINQCKKDTDDFMQKNLENSFREYPYYRNIVEELMEID